MTDDNKRQLPPTKKEPKGQVLTIAILLIMSIIMIGFGLLTQWPLIAVMFGLGLLSLGIGAAYFYNQDKKRKSGEALN